MISKCIKHDLHWLTISKISTDEILALACTCSLNMNSLKTKCYFKQFHKTMMYSRRLLFHSISWIWNFSLSILVFDSHCSIRLNPSSTLLAVITDQWINESWGIGCNRSIPATSNDQHPSHQSRSTAQANISVECHNSRRRTQREEKLYQLNWVNRHIL